MHLVRRAVVLCRKPPLLLWLAAAALLYLLGALQHLHLNRLADPSLLFGDDGDGFFNLWVLLHNTLYGPDGLTAWMDGHIFWPANGQTLFWSDILLVPSLPFAGFRTLGLDIFTSFRFTVMFLSVAGYAALLLLLQRFGQWSSAGRDHGRYDWLSLLFCFTTAFSINRMITYLHFQNLCGFGILLILLGAGGYSCTRRRRWLALALAAEVALLYTAPYYAVQGSIVFVLWLLLHGAVFPADILRDIRATWWLWFAAAFLALPPVLLYHQVPHLEYRPAMLHEVLASRPEHLWIPSRGALHDLLLSQGHELPGINHESLAYLGIGFLLLVVAALPMKIFSTWRNSEKLLPASQIIALTFIYLAYRLVRDSLPLLGYWLAWIQLLFLLLLLFIFLTSQAGKTRKNFLASLVLSVALISFGLALGPNHHFIEARFNPSIWGLLKLLVPGVANMRAIGRMAGIANVCLAVWLYLEYSAMVQAATRPAQKTAVLLLLLTGLFLQNLEAWPVQAKINHYPAERIQPADRDLETLQSLQPGIACVFPTRPWPRNTHAMLYFASLDNFTLINGYSARSTPLLDRLMAAGTTGEEPTTGQLAILAQTPCRYLVIWKRKISRGSLHNLMRRYPLAGETEQMSVLQLNRN